MVKKSGYSSTHPLSSLPSHYGAFRRCLEKEGPTVQQAWVAYMRSKETVGEQHITVANRLAQVTAP